MKEVLEISVALRVMLRKYFATNPSPVSSAHRRRTRSGSVHALVISGNDRSSASEGQSKLGIFICRGAIHTQRYKERVAARACQDRAKMESEEARPREEACDLRRDNPCEV
jgi:hypothetical protein